MLIGYECEYCINSGQSWPPERLCWDSRWKPPKPQWLWSRLELPAEDKGASKKTVHSTISDFQCKLLSVPFTGKCPWANPISLNERHFNWSKPSLKYHKQGPGNSTAPTERPTTTFNKTLYSKLDKPWETEQSMPALLAVDPHIRFLLTDSPRLKWALSGPSASISL